MKLTLEEVTERVTRIVAKQLEKEPEEVGLDQDIKDDLTADSLDVVEIALSIEDEVDGLSVKIPDEEAEKLRTVRQLSEYVADHQPGDNAEQKPAA